jgi:hypothetical protein
VRLDRPGLEERMGPVLETLAASGLGWLASWGGTAVTLSRLRGNDWRDPRGTSTFDAENIDLVDVLTRLEEARRSS